jgi:hypothetical protein
MAKHLRLTPEGELYEISYVLTTTIIWLKKPN